MSADSRAGTSRPRDVRDVAGDDGLGNYAHENVLGISGPLYDTEGILFAELDPERLRLARQKFDPVGHYHRPDLLALTLGSSSK